MPCSELSSQLHLSYLLLHLILRDGLPVSDLAELHAANHLAHKYQCPDVETRALSVLKRYYTPLHPLRSLRHIQTVGAINIARLTETVSTLPFALYHACPLESRMMDGYQRRDGTAEYLSAEDLSLWVSVRNNLAKEMVSFIKTVFKRTPTARCKTAERCTEVLVGECDVLDSYEEAIEIWAVDCKLCKTCKEAILDWRMAERKRV